MRPTPLRGIWSYQNSHVGVLYDDVEYCKEGEPEEVCSQRCILEHFPTHRIGHQPVDDSHPTCPPANERTLFDVDEPFPCTVAILQEVGDLSDQAEEISIVQLIAEPSRFDGEFVAVAGWLDGNALFLSSEMAATTVPANGVLLALPALEVPDECKAYQSMGGHIVRAQGIFWHTPTEPFAGEIRDISHLYVMLPRTNATYR